MSVSARGLAATMAMACMASAIAACSLLPSPTPPPAPAVFVPPDPPPGAADKALQALDPESVLRSVAGGRQCRSGSLIGSHGNYHMVRDYVCPRAGDDRTVYFLFTEAWESALLGMVRRAAAAAAA